MAENRDEQADTRFFSEDLPENRKKSTKHRKHDKKPVR